MSFRQIIYSAVVRRLTILFVTVFISGLAFILLFSLAKAAMATDLQSPLRFNFAEHSYTIGDDLPRIQCTDGATVTIYTEGLSSPDGLAFGTDNLLYVVEEGAGRVSQIATNGLTTTVLTGLNSPEGIAFDSSGNMYVTEDVVNGRIIKRNTAGLTTTVSTGRDAPEGVVWVNDNSANGVLYITEQNLEAAVAMSSTEPTDYRTHVTKIDLNSNMTTRILNKFATFTPVGIPPTKVNAVFWSYSGITADAQGNLYVVNELAGQMITGTMTVPPFGDIDYTATGGESAFKVNPNEVPVTDVALTSVITTPEGLRFSQGITFPLYIASEDTGAGMGRLSTVTADGTTTVYCSGFFNIEDVILGSDGKIYVSEDTTGLVIAITPPRFPIWLPMILRS